MQDVVESMPVGLQAVQKLLELLSVLVGIDVIVLSYANRVCIDNSPIQHSLMMAEIVER